MHITQYLVDSFFFFKETQMTETATARTLHFLQKREIFLDSGKLLEKSHGFELGWSLRIINPRVLWY